MADARLRWLFSGATLTLIFIALVSVVVVPMYSNYTERAHASSMIAELSSLRAEIESEALRIGSLQGVGASIELDPHRRMAKSASLVRILENGVILAQTATSGSLLILEPRLINGSVEWSCIGGPRVDMPTQCR